MVSVPCAPGTGPLPLEPAAALQPTPPRRTLPASLPLPLPIQLPPPRAGPPIAPPTPAWPLWSGGAPHRAARSTAAARPRGAGGRPPPAGRRPPPFRRPACECGHLKQSHRGLGGGGGTRLPAPHRGAAAVHVQSLSRGNGRRAAARQLLPRQPRRCGRAGPTAWRARARARKRWAVAAARPGPNRAWGAAAAAARAR
jgi:hypothetical protein